MYEPSFTTWTLTVVYQTVTPWDDDGPGPNPPSLLHVEIWRWQMQADGQSIVRLLNLLRDVPVGTSTSIPN
jgi:hypothetical protein